MNNTLIQVKIKDRINKGDSNDYPNIQPYQFIEAFNKSMDDWTRRQLQGINQTRTGAEGSTRRIDDLQVLLTDWIDTWTEKELYWESNQFPDDYLEWCRISAYCQDECKECPPRRFKAIFEGNEADVDLYLADVNRQPSYDWATTFSTVAGNKFRIWNNGQFDIVNPVLTYYKAPVHIQVAGVTNPDTGAVSTTDVLCEFPDNVIEVIIDGAAAILAGDIDNYQKLQQLTQQEERNT